MKRTWHVQGQYEYWQLQELHPEEGTGVYETLNFPTKKLAESAKRMIQKAYNDGRRDLMQELASYSKDLHD